MRESVIEGARTTGSAEGGSYGGRVAAATLHRRLFPLIKSLFVEGNPVGIKAAMKIAALDSGELRLPLWEASESTRKMIGDLMAQLR